MKKIFLLFLLLNFVAACQSTKDALTLQKKNTTDEFMIEKKSPLVLPPNFNELPVPDSEKISAKNNSVNNDDIESIVNKNKSLSNQTKNSKSTSLEKSILEKIE